MTVCSFVETDIDFLLEGFQLLDFEIADLLGAALREQLECEARYARVEWFAKTLQLRGVWFWVLSTTFVWIEHCVAHGVVAIVFYAKLGAGMQGRRPCCV